MLVNKVALIVRKPLDCWEGSRSVLGLLMQGVSASLFLVDLKVELPTDKYEQDFQDTLDMIYDMGGEIKATFERESQRWSLVDHLPLPELALALKDYDLVACFA